MTFFVVAWLALSGAAALILALVWWWTPDSTEVREFIEAAPGAVWSVELRDRFGGGVYPVVAGLADRGEVIRTEHPPRAIHGQGCPCLACTRPRISYRRRG